MRDLLEMLLKSRKKHSRFKTFYLAVFIFLFWPSCLTLIAVFLSLLFTSWSDLTTYLTYWNVLYFVFLLLLVYKQFTLHIFISDPKERHCARHLQAGSVYLKTITYVEFCTVKACQAHTFKKTILTQEKYCEPGEGHEKLTPSPVQAPARRHRASSLTITRHWGSPQDTMASIGQIIFWGSVSPLAANSNDDVTFWFAV